MKRKEEERKRLGYKKKNKGLKMNRKDKKN